MNEIDLLKMAAAAQRRAVGPDSLIAKRIDELIEEARREQASQVALEDHCNQLPRLAD